MSSCSHQFDLFPTATSTPSPTNTTTTVRQSVGVPTANSVIPTPLNSVMHLVFHGLPHKSSARAYRRADACLSGSAMPTAVLQVESFAWSRYPDVSHRPAVPCREIGFDLEVPSHQPVFESLFRLVALGFSAELCSAEKQTRGWLGLEMLGRLSCGIWMNVVFVTKSPLSKFLILR